MSKRKAVIVRTVIFLCVFVLAFITAGRITGVFEPGSSHNFEAFGEGESTTAKAVAATA
ncbi:MAG: hypothetical protein MJ177_02700 [Clostridia bacterium]|nr:hypothetical protein [Clostridia bacterium]